MKTITITCFYCGYTSEKPAKEIRRQQKKGKTQFFCNRACFQLYQKLNLSDTWQAWHFRARYSWIKILKRPLICSTCGKKSKHNEIHHKDGNHKNNNPKNLDCLCKFHHKQADLARINARLEDKNPALEPVIVNFENKLIAVYFLAA